MDNNKDEATHGTGHRVGYKRVSTADQSTARQLDGIELDKVFEDKASGKSAERPELQAALKYLRRGDTLVCHSMDRLSRSLADLLKIVSDLTSRGVAVQFVKEGKTFTGDDDKEAELMLAMLGAFAAFERAMIRERQREGIEIAKTKGVYQGRKQALTDAQVAEVREKVAADPGIDKTALAREYGISRVTLYRYLRNENQNEETSISP